MWGWKTSVLLSVKHHTCQLRDNVFGHKSRFRIQRRKLCPAHCLLPSENRNRRSGKPNVFGIFTPDFQTNLSLFSTLLNGEYLDALMENVRQQISFLYSCFPAMLGDIAVTVANYRWTIKRSCFQMKYQSVQIFFVRCTMRRWEWRIWYSSKTRPCLNELWQYAMWY